MRCELPNPNRKMVRFGDRTGVLYYFVADKLNFDLAGLYKRQTRDSLLCNHIPDGRGIPQMPLILFESIDQQKRFLEYISNNPERVPNTNYTLSDFDRTLYPEDENHIGIGYDLRSAYLEWR
jgi:hypothetical protein